jgi:8-oxo-dGTP pyrophosphatase MutT (NUDIX family)
MVRTLRKVVAYIIREKAGERQLLVFIHRDFPEAGLQVPAGTVEDDETIEAGLKREVVEETGLRDFEVVREIATYDRVHPVTGNTHERHVFLLTVPPSTPDEWIWVETDGGKKSELEGYVFCYGWANLSGKIDLAGGLGDYLHAFREI